MTGEPERISMLLQSVADGERQAAEALLPEVYTQLRNQARGMLANERPGQTIQATALVHEAYMRVAGKHDPGWGGRGHFYAAAAEAMRRILIDGARNKKRLKRGGDKNRVDVEDLDAIDAAIDGPDGDVLAVHEALKDLEEADPRARQIVNLRYFAGLTTQETATALGISTATVGREWRFIRAWLEDALDKGD